MFGNKMDILHAQTVEPLLIQHLLCRNLSHTSEPLQRILLRRVFLVVRAPRVQGTTRKLDTVFSRVGPRCRVGSPYGRPNCSVGLAIVQLPLRQHIVVVCLRPSPRAVEHLIRQCSRAKYRHKQHRSLFEARKDGQNLPHCNESMLEVVKQDLVVCITAVRFEMNFRHIIPIRNTAHFLKKKALAGCPFWNEIMAEA